MKIGKAKYSNNVEFIKRNWWKLRDGEQVFRILPPMGDLAESGKWSMFYKIHYGYKNTAGKMRVFQSPLVVNRATKMVEVPDAALERIETLKAEFEKAKKSNDTASVDKIGKLLKNFNLDSNHYVNAMDQHGNIGILRLRHRAKLVLDSAIKRLEKEGVDPLSADNGRFFVFRRTGNGLDTSFQVEVLKEKIKVEGIGTVEREMIHTLTPEIISRLGTEAAQLEKLFNTISAENVQRIVTEGAKAVDELLETKSKTATASATSSVESSEDFEDSLDSESESTTVTVTPVAPKVTKVAPKATPVAAAAEQSDEDFLASLGL